MVSSKNKQIKIPQKRAKPTIPINPSQKLTKQHENNLVGDLQKLMEKARS